MSSHTEKLIISIVGPIGSGKDTVAELISSLLHIKIRQISEPLRQIAQKQGIQQTRENLIELGTKTALEFGPDFLARQIYQNNEFPLIITGMRQPEQIKFFSQVARNIIISIDADPAIRFERAKMRGRSGEATDLQTFLMREQEENAPPRTQRVFECMKLATYHVENNTSLQELSKKILTILKKEKLL